MSYCRLSTRVGKLLSDVYIFGTDDNKIILQTSKNIPNLNVSELEFSTDAEGLISLEMMLETLVVDGFIVPSIKKLMSDIYSDYM